MVTRQETEKRLLVHFGVHPPLKNPNDKIEGKFWANICTSVPRGMGRGRHDSTCVISTPPVVG